ncbi:MAG: hypothetical protein JWQ04_1627 [Pedosphaera sp.]|nr:hypothetical protein [Pedosphaera sp.]
MNTRLMKEQRSLRPVFYATLAATALISLVFNGSDAAGFVITTFAAGMVLMAASSFGNELHARTMLLLLAQPVPRRRIWLEKMRALGIKLAIGFAALLLCLFMFVTGEGRLEHFPLMALAMASIPLFAFCSTPYFSLRSKNSIVAMASTAVVPGLMVMIVMWIDWFVTWRLGRPQLYFKSAAERHPVLLWSAVAVVALGYCIQLYRMGYKAFLNFQDVDSQAKEVGLPAGVERAIAPWLDKIMPGYTGPFASLLRKELRLHHVSFILTSLSAIALPFLAVAWKLHPSDMLAGLMSMLLVLCVIGTPLITGIVTLAEERNLGVAAWQLTLPASVRKQWAAKMLVAVFTCITLGIVFPAAMLAAGKWLFGMSTAKIFSADPDELLLVAACYALLFNLVIYASSISVNSVRAMVIVLGLLAGCGAAIALGIYGLGLAQIHFDVLEPISTVSLTIYFLLLSVLLNRLSFLNYRTAQLDNRRTWIQLSAILLFAGISPLVIEAMEFLVAGLLAHVEL